MVLFSLSLLLFYVYDDDYMKRVLIFSFSNLPTRYLSGKTINNVNGYVHICALWYVYRKEKVIRIPDIILFNLPFQRRLYSRIIII